MATMIAGETLNPLAPIFIRPRRNAYPCTTSMTTRVTFSKSSATLSLPTISTSSLSLKPPMQNPNHDHNHNHNPTSKYALPNFSLPLNSPLALTAITVGSGIVLHFLAGGGNSGGFFGGGGGGGGGSRGSGGGGSFWSRLRSFFVANAREDDESQSPEWDPHGLSGNLVLQMFRLNGLKRYKVSEVEFVDRSTSEFIDSNDSFFDHIVSIRPNEVYTKAQLKKKHDELAECGLFEKVDIETRTKPDGTIGVVISFVEMSWDAKDRAKFINVGLMPPNSNVTSNKDPKQMSEREVMEYIKNQEREYEIRMEKARPCLLPESMQREVSSMLGEGRLTARLMRRIGDKVTKWYHDNGYVCAEVSNFGNLNRKEVVCEVDEGDISQVVVQFQDKLGNLCEGNTQYGVIKRQLPESLQPGNVFNIKDGKQALNNLHSLALFSNMEVVPRPDGKGGYVVEIKLKEMEQKSADVAIEWNIEPVHGGRPTLASIRPGGTVSFEHRNLKGLNRSALGSVTTSNLLNPQDDLSFKFEYVNPYLDGLNSSRNRTLRTSCFNSRKLSPVFTSGPGMVEVPPVLVDRVGIKTNITENFTSQSKFSYGVVMEEITTRDESSNICSNGPRLFPTQLLGAGPPTTLSGTGTDRVAFLQANITRDNTKSVNGALVGERNVFQLDQGLFIGSKFPFFNRHQLTYTKFLQLMAVEEEGAGKSPPPVLVLHGHYGGCVGDLPSYDAFTLGGPYSVRGYSMGEIGAARNIVEVAAELRIPVGNTHVYAFAEHGNDLGSSKEVKGNPTEVYSRRGQGSSYGIGAKLGMVRAEYAIDHNSGTGAVFLRVGERF